jgi:D-glycero-D-manno-heptose 1,7-bisphosphate phosphatase
MMRAAVFLDRDGTIMVETHYPSDPDSVVLLSGALEALRRLRAAGYALVLVTNQSGIARGLYSEDDFRKVQARLETLLDEGGVRLDAVLFCPHHPDFTGPCDCRKPGLGMYRQAEAALGVDLAASIYVGDRVRDVLPALQTGGAGYLVRTGHGADEAELAPAGIEVIDDLRALARIMTGR